MPVDHAFVQANGVRLHYIACGTGAPILFLHGFPEYSGAWLAVMGHLGERFRCIAIDTRGVHRSEAPERVDAYHLDQLVMDVCEVITALGYRKVTLVGHDWGGFIAWETAIRHPEVIDRLVILNTAHNGVFDQMVREGGAQSTASRYMLAFRSARGEDLIARNDYGGFRAEILEPALASGRMTPGQAQEYLALWRRPNAMTPPLNYYRANRSGPPSGDDNPPRRLEDTVVRVPTLVIWGEQDPYFAIENLDRLAQVVPELTIRRFTDSGHWIVHERPDEVARLIAGFIDDKAGPADER